MSGPLEVAPDQRRALLRRWRWRLCCGAVIAVTYAAIYIALRIPSNHFGANFLFTAFPAAVLQFIIIDIAVNGFSVRGERGAKTRKPDEVRHVSRVFDGPYVVPRRADAAARERVLRIIRDSSTARAAPAEPPDSH